MRKWLALLVACLALGLVVAGCGGDDDDDGGGNGGGAAEEQQPAETAGEGGGTGAAEVSMRDIQFEPSNLSVKRGDTVTWINRESVPHDVDGGGEGVQFSSGPEGGMNDGDRFEFTFEKAGTYDYVCRVHAPGMAGTVTVE